MTENAYDGLAIGHALRILHGIFRIFLERS
jgi:hypothetical protein